MGAARVLDVENIARIGLLFLDGDTLEEVFLDEYGPADYNFAKFTEIRRSLLMIEQINPDLTLITTVWRLHPANVDLVVPVVNGSNYSNYDFTAFFRARTNEQLKEVFEHGVPQVLKRSEQRSTYYYPIRNSDAEIVGALELTVTSN